MYGLCEKWKRALVRLRRFQTNNSLHIKKIWFSQKISTWCMRCLMKLRGDDYALGTESHLGPICTWDHDGLETNYSSRICTWDQASLGTKKFTFQTQLQFGTWGHESWRTWDEIALGTMTDLGQICTRDSYALGTNMDFGPWRTWNQYGGLGTSMHLGLIGTWDRFALETEK